MQEVKPTYFREPIPDANRVFVGRTLSPDVASQLSYLRLVFDLTMAGTEGHCSYNPATDCLELFITVTRGLELLCPSLIGVDKVWMVWKMPPNQNEKGTV